MKNIIFVVALLAGQSIVAQNVGIGVPTPLQKLEVDGAIKIGTSNTNEPGSIRFTGTNFEGGDGVKWKALEALPAGTIVLSETLPNADLLEAGFTHVGYSDAVTSQKDSTPFQQANSWRTISSNAAPSYLKNYSTLPINNNLFLFGGLQNGILSNQGYIYDKTSDNWEVLNKLNAPTPRHNNIGMLQTNAEVIIIGGDQYGFPSSFYGAKYRLSTKVWSPISSVNGPSPRSGFELVWTGTRMLLWGGLATGGIYNPINNTWLTISEVNAPSARKEFQSFWTGTEWIIWGGRTTGFPSTIITNGAKYNPTTNTWTTISTVNAPLNNVNNKAGAALWTGTEMIIWGGANAVGTSIQTGARYNPVTNTWTTMAALNAPTPRIFFNSAWTGSQLLVWGGVTVSAPIQSGARYDPGSNIWTTMPTLNSPPPRQNYQSVYNGTSFILWGGVELVLGSDGFATEKEYNEGYQYNLATNSWIAFSKRGAPTPRQVSSSTGLVYYWAGDRLIVWGGAKFNENSPTYSDNLYEGGRYFINAPVGTTYFDAGPKRYFFFRKN